MKLCLIGDSHAAMIIAAHRQSPAGAELTVFAKPGLAAEEIALDGASLRAASPDMRRRLAQMGTPDRLDLAGFDAVAIAGLAPSAFAAVRLQQNHVVTGWPSGAAAMAQALSDAPSGRTRPLMTRAAYQAALRMLTDRCLAAALARVAPGPVAILPQPFPSDAILDQSQTYPIFRRVVRQGDGAALAADLTGAHQHVFEALPNTVYLPQPADSLSHGCLTRAEFMRGGPRLADGSQQQNDDVLHGNLALGQRQLQALRAGRMARG